MIDPKNMKVDELSRFHSRTATGPQGMAIGPDNQILLGCNAPSPNGHRNTVIINRNSGAVLAVFQDLGGADEVWFNPGRRPLLHPDLQHSLPHCSSAICPHWCRVLGIVDCKRTPAGPNGFYRGAEQRPRR